MDELTRKRQAVDEVGTSGEAPTRAWRVNTDFHELDAGKAPTFNSWKADQTRKNGKRHISRETTPELDQQDCWIQRQVEKGRASQSQKITDHHASQKLEARVSQDSQLSHTFLGVSDHNETMRWLVATKRFLMVRITEQRKQDHNRDGCSRASLKRQGGEPTESAHLRHSGKL